MIRWFGLVWVSQVFHVGSVWIWFRSPTIARFNCMLLGHACSQVFPELLFVQTFLIIGFSLTYLQYRLVLIIIIIICFVQRNYRFFYMFVFSTTLICLYVFAFCWVYIIKIRNAEDLSIWRAMLKTPASIVLIIYCFLCVWFVGGLSVFHFYLMSTNQTTYENFRYRYDRRANPYHRGILNNILEIFCSSIPPSKNNFRARVTVEQGIQQAQSPSRGFMSPNMGKPVGDLEMGRKPVAWDEPRTAADINDLEIGLGGMLGEKEGRVTHASPNVSQDGFSPELVEGRAGMHSSRSSWDHRVGSLGSVDSNSLQTLPAEETNGGGHTTTSSAH